jgi:hypothetical protein
MGSIEEFLHVPMNIESQVGKNNQAAGVAAAIPVSNRHNSLRAQRKIMKKLQEYFESSKGFGVLATADSDGKVDAAIYSRPHFLEKDAVTFILRDRLTHHNLQSNPSATFLFVEEGAGFHGKRLYLKRIREENNPDLVKKIKRRKLNDENEEPMFLVYFTVEKELPLIGGDTA